MTRADYEAVLAQLRALQATVEAALAQKAAGFATLEAAQQQVEATIATLDLAAEEAGPEACVRCKSTDVAPAGTDDQGRAVTVCATCGANVAGGQVIGG